jgi:hypothetical protein
MDVIGSTDSREVSARRARRWILIAMMSHSASGSDIGPATNLFCLPAPALRPLSAKEVHVGQPTAEFLLQTRKAGPELGLLMQRHEAMNGSSLLKVRPTAPSGIQRTLDRFLPPNRTLFSKNPNARRDPLAVDGW